MSEATVYIVYKILAEEPKLAGVFPNTIEGMQEALEFGEENFEKMHAAEPDEYIDGE